jgi:hypothetical protein
MLYLLKVLVRHMLYLLSVLVRTCIIYCVGWLIALSTPLPPHASCCLLTKEFESVKVLARQLLSKYHAFFHLALTPPHPRKKTRRPSGFFFPPTQPARRSLR